MVPVGDFRDPDKRLGDPVPLTTRYRGLRNFKSLSF